MKNVINDCYLEVFGKKPSQRIIKEIKFSLPSSVIIAADEWGEYDTIVGDEICKWLKENKDFVLSL